MVSKFGITTGILCIWIAFDIIVLTPILWRLHYDKKISYLGIQGIISLYFIFLLVIIVCLIVYQPSTQTYKCIDNVCSSVPCDLDDPNCFTFEKCTELCHLQSTYMIQARNLDKNNDHLYLTVSDGGQLILTPSQEGEDYVRQLWHLNKPGGKPYFINPSFVGSANVYFRSAWNPEWCIGSGDNAVSCLDEETQFNYINNVHLKDGETICLNHDNGEITRRYCIDGSDEWIFIQVE